MEKRLQKVSYDPETDALYIKLQEGIYEESEEITPSCFVDMGKDWSVLGIELLDVKKNKGLFEYLFFKSGTFESWVSSSPSTFLTHLQQDLSMLSWSQASSRLQTA
jgi:uncharacterized protein YuzE